MARVVKEAEYNAKRNEILDYTLSLIYSKGYEQMTVQDILDGLHISRGALYHYFDSKQAMLEALVERMGKAAIDSFLPILQDPHLTALEKFRAYFEASAQWKSAGKTVIVSGLRMWYTDENAIFRQKLNSYSIKGITGILEPIIRQGIEEQVFTTRYPEQAALLIAGIALNMGDTVIEMMFSHQPIPSSLQKLGMLMDAYFDALERILGAPPGSLKVFAAEDFEEWFEVSLPEPAST